MTQAATIPNTQVHIVHSDIMDFDFEITLQTPVFEAPGPLPVIYSTDANALLPGTVCAVNQLQMIQEIPPVMNVNIGYPVGMDMAYVLARRIYDFTLSATEQQLIPFNNMVQAMNSPVEVKSGGASLFTRFLTEELWAWISERFDVVDDRTFIGNSLGGFFGCHLMFNQQADFFKRFILGSPYIYWNKDYVFGLEADYAREHSDLCAAVFVSAGDSEDFVTPAMDPVMAEDFKQARIAEWGKEFCDKLISRNYPGLNINYRVFPEQTHNMSPFTSIPHGLKHVYADLMG